MIYYSKARLPEQYELCLDHTFCKCNFFVRVTDLLICHLLDGITCALAEILLNQLMLTRSMPKPMALNCINRDIAYCCTHTHQPATVATCQVGLFQHLEKFSQEEGWHTGGGEEKAGLTCPPDSAPAPAEVLAGVCWRGEEEEWRGEREEEGEWSWPAADLAAALPQVGNPKLSLLLTYTPSRCSVGKLCPGECIGIWEM